MNAQSDDLRHEAELIDALDALERGESVEAVLRRNPAAAEALRPAIETAAALAAAARPPSAAQVDASRNRLLAAFDALAAGAASAPSSAASSTSAASLTRAASQSPAAASHRPRLAIDRDVAPPRPMTRRAPRPLRTIWAMAAGVAALLVGVPVAYAASNALPGDALYAVKEAGRGAWLATAPGAEAHRARSAAVSAARRADVAVAMAGGRNADVLFEGVIEAYATEWCRISGLTVNVPPDVAQYGASEHPGAFGVGDHVFIRARMNAGRLVAFEMLPYLDYGLPAPTVPHGPADSRLAPSPTPSPAVPGGTAGVPGTTAAVPGAPTSDPPLVGATAPGRARPATTADSPGRADDSRSTGGQDVGDDDRGGDDRGGEDEGNDDKGGDDTGGEDEGDDKGGDDKGGEDEGGDDKGGDRKP